MKKNIYLLLIIFVNLSAQDRTLIFSTGEPTSTDGYEINWDGNSGQSVSDRFFVNTNMVLEALRLYAKAESDSAMARIILQEDNNGVPGNEIHYWDLNIFTENHGSNSVLILTTDLCIFLNEGNHYWITLQALNDSSQITWLYSNEDVFTYSISNDNGTSWQDTYIGNCGSLLVFAEYVYESEFQEIEGDVNMDGGLNVLDIVLLSNIILSGEYSIDADINLDGGNNVLDIVELVNIILNENPLVQLSTWDYYDINNNSEYFGQLIGPDTFSGNVSLYYFGKAG